MYSRCNSTYVGVYTGIIEWRWLSLYIVICVSVCREVLDHLSWWWILHTIISCYHDDLIRIRHRLYHDTINVLHWESDLVLWILSISCQNNRHKTTCAPSSSVWSGTIHNVSERRLSFKVQFVLRYFAAFSVWYI